MQNTYEHKLIEIQRSKNIDEQAELAKKINYKYFVDLVNLPELRGMTVKKPEVVLQNTLLMIRLLNLLKNRDSPGIVVGRLQHDGIIAHNRCSKLKEKYVIEINHTA